MSTAIEIEFATEEEAEEFKAAADELGMSESEYAIWLFENFGRKPRRKSPDAENDSRG